MPNFASIWEGIVDAVPGATAAAHGFDAHTWSEFEDRSARIAAALGAAGVGHDDKVGLYLYNGFEYEEVQFAAFKQRAVPCNVNYRYLSDELLHLLTNADAKAVFFDHSLADRIADMVTCVSPDFDRRRFSELALAGDHQRCDRARAHRFRAVVVCLSMAALSSAG